MSEGFVGFSMSRSGKVQLLFQPPSGEGFVVEVSPQAAVGLSIGLEAFLRQRLEEYGPFPIWIETLRGAVTMVHASDCRGAMEACELSSFALQDETYSMHMVAADPLRLKP